MTDSKTVVEDLAAWLGEFLVQVVLWVLLIVVGVAGVFVVFALQALIEALS